MCLSSRTIAFVGQIFTHQAPLHCVQAVGMYTASSGKRVTLMRDRLGFSVAVCLSEQASSHARQAVHLSGRMLNSFATTPSARARHRATFL
jgi:hypothetical protein